MIGRTPAPHEPWTEARVCWRDVGCAWVFVFALFALFAVLVLG